VWIGEPLFMNDTRWGPVRLHWLWHSQEAPAIDGKIRLAVVVRANVGYCYVPAVQRRKDSEIMYVGLAIIAGITLLLVSVGFVVMRRRQPPVRPNRDSSDANQTVNWQRHNETGTDWRQRP
jgi:hypothetical protein